MNGGATNSPFSDPIDLLAQVQTLLGNFNVVSNLQTPPIPLLNPPPIAQVRGDVMQQAPPPIDDNVVKLLKANGMYKTNFVPAEVPQSIAELNANIARINQAAQNQMMGILPQVFPWNTYAPGLGVPALPAQNPLVQAPFLFPPPVTPQYFPNIPFGIPSMPSMSQFAPQNLQNQTMESLLKYQPPEQPISAFNPPNLNPPSTSSGYHSASLQSENSSPKQEIRVEESEQSTSEIVPVETINTLKWDAEKKEENPDTDTAFSYAKMFIDGAFTEGQFIHYTRLLKLGSALAVDPEDAVNPLLATKGDEDLIKNILFGAPIPLKTPATVSRQEEIKKKNVPASSQQRALEHLSENTSSVLSTAHWNQEVPVTGTTSVLKNTETPKSTTVWVDMRRASQQDAEMFAQTSLHALGDFDPMTSGTVFRNCSEVAPEEVAESTGIQAQKEEDQDQETFHKSPESEQKKIKEDRRIEIDYFSPKLKALLVADRKPVEAYRSPTPDSIVESSQVTSAVSNKLKSSNAVENSITDRTEQNVDFVVAPNAQSWSTATDVSDSNSLQSVEKLNDDYTHESMDILQIATNELDTETSIAEEPTTVQKLESASGIGLNVASSFPTSTSASALEAFSSLHSDSSPPVSPSLSEFSHFSTMVQPSAPTSNQCSPTETSAATQSLSSTSESQVQDKMMMPSEQTEEPTSSPPTASCSPIPSPSSPSTSSNSTCAQEDVTIVTRSLKYQHQDETHAEGETISPDVSTNSEVLNSSSDDSGEKTPGALTLTANDREVQGTILSLQNTKSQIVETTSASLTSPSHDEDSEATVTFIPEEKTDDSLESLSLVGVQNMEHSKPIPEYEEHPITIDDAPASPSEPDADQLENLIQTEQESTSTISSEDISEENSGAQLPTVHEPVAPTNVVEGIDENIFPSDELANASEDTTTSASIVETTPLILDLPDDSEDSEETAPTNVVEQLDVSENSDNARQELHTEEVVHASEDTTSSKTTTAPLTSPMISEESEEALSIVPENAARHQFVSIEISPLENPKNVEREIPSPEIEESIGEEVPAVSPMIVPDATSSQTVETTPAILNHPTTCENLEETASTVPEEKNDLAVDTDTSQEPLEPSPLELSENVEKGISNSDIQEPVAEQTLDVPPMIVPEQIEDKTNEVSFNVGQYTLITDVSTVASEDTTAGEMFETYPDSAESSKNENEFETTYSSASEGVAYYTSKSIESSSLEFFENTEKETTSPEIEEPMQPANPLELLSIQSAPVKLSENVKTPSPAPEVEESSIVEKASARETVTDIVEDLRQTKTAKIPTMSPVENSEHALNRQDTVFHESIIPEGSEADREVAEGNEDDSTVHVLVVPTNIVEELDAIENVPNVEQKILRSEEVASSTDVTPSIESEVVTQRPLTPPTTSEDSEESNDDSVEKIAYVPKDVPHVSIETFASKLSENVERQTPSPDIEDSFGEETPIESHEGNEDLLSTAVDTSNQMVQTPPASVSPSTTGREFEETSFPISEGTGQDISKLFESSALQLSENVERETTSLELDEPTNIGEALAVSPMIAPELTEGLQCLETQETMVENKPSNLLKPLSAQVEDISLEVVKSRNEEDEDPNHSSAFKQFLEETEPTVCSSSLTTHTNSETEESEVASSSSTPTVPRSAVALRESSSIEVLPSPQSSSSSSSSTFTTSDWEGPSADFYLFVRSNEVENNGKQDQRDSQTTEDRPESSNSSTWEIDDDELPESSLREVRKRKVVDENLESSDEEDEYFSQPGQSTSTKPSPNKRARPSGNSPAAEIEEEIVDLDSSSETEIVTNSPITSSEVQEAPKERGRKPKLKISPTTSSSEVQRKKRGRPSNRELALRKGIVLPPEPESTPAQRLYAQILPKKVGRPSNFEMEERKIAIELIELVLEDSRPSVFATKRSFSSEEVRAIQLIVEIKKAEEEGDFNELNEEKEEFMDLIHQMAKDLVARKTLKVRCSETTKSIAKKKEPKKPKKEKKKTCQKKKTKQKYADDEEYEPESSTSRSPSPAPKRIRILRSGIYY